MIVGSWAVVSSGLKGFYAFPLCALGHVHRPLAPVLVDNAIYFFLPLTLIGASLHCGSPFGDCAHLRLPGPYGSGSSASHVFHSPTSLSF